MNPPYEILNCPDGEECLARLERIYLLANDPDGHVDDGLLPCEKCLGSGWVEVDYHHNRRCPACRGTRKGKVRSGEPSSHRRVRAILKGELPGQRILDHEHITVLIGNQAVTATLLEWRYMLNRGSDYPNIGKVFDYLKEELKTKIPVVFEDL